MNGARFMCIISPRRIDVGSIRPEINPPEKALHDQMYLWNRTHHLGGRVKYICQVRGCFTRISNTGSHYKYRPKRCARCVRLAREVSR